MEPAPPITEPQSEAPKPAGTSLAARLLNVFAVPGDVFDEVKAGRITAANWLVPVLLWAVVGVIFALIIFSQPAIQQQLREQQARTLDKLVETGKMTRADADDAMAKFEKYGGPTLLKISGSVGAVLLSFVHVFWWALVLWLAGRWFFKAQFRYLKALEVTGLAMMIGVLGQIVTLLLVVNLARLFATPSLGLVISDFDATRKSHLVLGAANVFSFWLVGVMALGLAKLAGVPFLRAAFPVLAYWLLQESLLIMLGLGQFAL